MHADGNRRERPWTFKYQWRKRDDAEWTDGETSAHSGANFEMYKGETWLAMHPDLDHRIIAADGSTAWMHDRHQ